MIWGVDLGVREFYAFGIPVESDLEFFPMAFKHKCPKGKTRYDELRDMGLYAHDSFLEDDYVFAEEPPFVRNFRTYGQLSMSAGAILSATSAQGYLVPVDSWKREVIGRGGVGKPVVAQWLEDHHPEYHRACLGDQNLMDAACLALYGRSILATAHAASPAEPGDLGDQV